MSTGGLNFERIHSLLKSSTFLGCLSDVALKTLVRSGMARRFAKGEVVCSRGDAGHSAMLVLAGRLKVSNTTADGREIGLNFLGVGDLVGEIAVLDGKERTANVIALEDSEVFMLHRRDLMPVLATHPEALLEIVHALCEKLRIATAIIEDSTHEMPARVARGLLRLAEQHGVRKRDRIHVQLTLSQTELGNYFGLSRANTSRQLTQLKEAGVIEIEDHTIVILDERGLLRVAEASPADRQ